MIRCFRTLVGQDIVAEQTAEGLRGLCYLIAMPDPTDPNKVRVMMKPALEMWAKDPLGYVAVNESGVLFSYEASAGVIKQYNETVMMTKAQASNIVIAQPDGRVQRRP